LCIWLTSKKTIHIGIFGATDFAVLADKLNPENSKKCLDIYEMGQILGGPLFLKSS
jgi:hypothetical protein